MCSKVNQLHIYIYPHLFFFFKFPSHLGHNRALSTVLIQLYFSCSVVSYSLLPWGLQHFRQAALSFTISWSLPKLMSIESVMPSNHLILCCHRFPLVIYVIQVSVVYTYRPQSPSSSHLPSSPLGVHTFVLHICVSGK